MCFTRVRASPYATYVASIRCVVLRAPRSSRSFLHRNSSAAPCQRVRKQHSGLDDDESVSHLFLSYLIINHLLGTSASSRHFARCRTQAGSAGVHSQVEMTGAAFLGRRWADRLCRDRTVTLQSRSPYPTNNPNPHKLIQYDTAQNH